MRRHWTFSTLGVLIYLVLVGWVLFASIARFLIELGSSEPVTWQPLVGVTVGLLGLTGIGWGHIIDRDDEPER